MIVVGVGQRVDGAFYMLLDLGFGILTKFDHVICNVDGL